MKRSSSNIASITLSAFVLAGIFSADPSAADSIIRIIGDRSAKTPASSSEPPPVDSFTSSGRGNSAIRIIGDKVESTPKKVSEPPILTESAAKESKAKAVAPLGEERTSQDKTGQETIQRQAATLVEEQRQEALRAEEQLKAAEKAELDRQARLKAAQEKDAAEAVRQAVMKQEQEQLAARKAEELRKAAEKAEQERRAALKADEERLAAAQKATAERLRLELEVPVPAPQPAPAEASEAGTQQEPATAWDLYLAAKAIDPALGRTEARVTGSKADSDLLLSALLPHLDSSAGIKRISQTLVNYSPDDIKNDYTGLNYGVTARLTLLHVPTMYSLSAAAAGLSGEQAGVSAARQNLISKFTEAYFALLKAQTDKQIALGEINRLKQVLDQSQAFLKAGTGDIISVYEAQSRLDSAGADLTKSESNLRLAEQKLSSLVGKPVSAVVNYLTKQPAGPEPDSLDWWVATMEKEQPVIRQAREGVAQTVEQRKAAKAEYLPILQASGGYDVSRGAATLPSAEARQWYVGASISLPLYSGGETSAKVRRAAASEEERRHILDETMDQHRENVKQAFFNLRYNISLIKALDQKKASAEIQLAAIKKGRKIGTRNAIDVLNAEQAYSIALRDYRYALYDNVLRTIQLKSAAGILAETDISGLSSIAAPALDSALTMLVSQVAPR